MTELRIACPFSDPASGMEFAKGSKFGPLSVSSARAPRFYFPYVPFAKGGQQE